MNPNDGNKYQGPAQNLAGQQYQQLPLVPHQQQHQQSQQMPQWSNYPPPQPSHSHMHPQLQQLPQPLNGPGSFNSPPGWNPVSQYTQYSPRQPQYGYPTEQQYQYPPVQVEQMNMAASSGQRKSYTQKDHAEQQKQYEQFIGSQLPPYAIATINNTNVKRPRAMNEANPNAPKKGFRNSRRRHRNSHLGCATCKSRRIKCDEQLPECRNCVRARLSCAYLALDDTARDALKVAQQAHAARIQALELHANAQEAKNTYLYPYKSEGLPTKILTHPPTDHPQSLVKPLQINLQRPFLPESLPPVHTSSYQIVTQPIPQTQGILSGPPTAQNPQSQVFQHPSTSSLVAINSSASPLAESSSDGTKTSTSGSASGRDCSISPEPRFAIEQDSYTSLVALIKEHKDVPQQRLDDLSKLDGEYVEITLDPECTKNLNTYWKPYDKAKEKLYNSGFEKEVLYKEYDDYYENLMREARNNIVLFKSLLSNGASVLSQSSKRDEVKKTASKQLNRDFEITLRFLNKFKIQFTQNITNLPDFFENVSLCFSKFQIFQTSLPITFFGSHSLKDNVELTNRYFGFISDYLKEEFNVFLNDEIVQKYKDNPYFRRASLFNDFIHIFVDYFAQCIKSYHTRVYKTLFIEETLNNFKALKPTIYEKLDDRFKQHYDDLVYFLEPLNEYLKGVRDKEAETNRLQVIFYCLKKFISILPDEAHTSNVTEEFETRIIISYYSAVSASLNAIFPEARFYFFFSFNGRHGIRSLSDVLNSLRKSNFTEEQNKALAYPTRIIEFFKKRTLIISGFLKDASTFPARIMLDEQNKKILTKLVQEDQLESFEDEIKNSAYPHIDQSSDFVNKETNSIVIPSVSLTQSYTNFPVLLNKRVEHLKQAIDSALTELDKTLFDKFFKLQKKN